MAAAWETPSCRAGPFAVEVRSWASEKIGDHFNDRLRAGHALPQKAIPIVV